VQPHEHFSSASCSLGALLYTSLTGWSWSSAICKQENIGYAVTSGACAKPDMFVNLASNAAGKSFCSGKVCILSHEHESLKFFFFFSLSRFGKGFLQGCLHFIAEREEPVLVIPVQPLEVLSRALYPRVSVDLNRSLDHWRTAGCLRGLFCTCYFFR